MTTGYGSQPVIHSLDLEVDAGEVVALLGANGAGKTTTLLALSGELPLMDGEVLIDGVRRDPSAPPAGPSRAWPT